MDERGDRNPSSWRRLKVFVGLAVIAFAVTLAHRRRQPTPARGDTGAVPRVSAGGLPTGGCGHTAGWTATAQPLECPSTFAGRADAADLHRGGRSTNR